jgi:DNA/RNA endonuclease G (NUC1)
VEELEQETGFTFFSKLPAAVATEVKRQKSLDKWN